MTRAAGQKGFSLIEVVVTIGIIGVALVASGVLVRAVPLGRQTRDKDLALAIAGDKIEAVRSAGYSAMPASGSFSNTLLASLPGGGTGTLTVADYNAKTKQVTVTVAWKEPNTATSTLSLVTLVTQTGGLP